MVGWGGQATGEYQHRLLTLADSPPPQKTQRAASRCVAGKASLPAVSVAVAIPSRPPAALHATVFVYSSSSSSWYFRWKPRFGGIQRQRLLCAAFALYVYTYVTKNEPQIFELRKSLSAANTQKVRSGCSWLGVTCFASRCRWACSTDGRRGRFSSDAGGVGRHAGKIRL